MMSRVRALSYSILSNIVIFTGLVLLLRSNVEINHCPVIDLTYAEELVTPVSTKDLGKVQEIFRMKESSKKASPATREIEPVPQRSVPPETSEKIEPSSQLALKQEVNSQSSLQTQEMRNSVESSEGSQKTVERSGSEVSRVSLREGTGGSGMQTALGHGGEDRVAMVEYQRLYEKRNWKVVRELIQKNLIYPPQAIVMGLEGRVVLRICVEKSRLCGEEILESAGFRLFDVAVLEAVKRADGKFPYSDYRVFLVLPIKFELREVK